MQQGRGKRELKHAQTSNRQTQIHTHTHTSTHHEKEEAKCFMLIRWFTKLEPSTESQTTYISEYNEKCLSDTIATHICKLT